ncbi:MAG: addiction module protein [Hyphomonadaceae bacterium]|nr:addiction module protein [Hyphomonadaceae bacterium]
MIHDEITKLSAAERLSLIGDIWDSLADSDVPLSPAQREELDRRLASFDEDKKQTVSWEALKADLDARKR